MLTNFVRSLIPMVEAVAVGLPEVRAEAEAFAAALRRHVGETGPNVGPSIPPDPG